MFKTVPPVSLQYGGVSLHPPPPVDPQRQFYGVAFLHDPCILVVGQVPDCGIQHLRLDRRKTFLDFIFILEYHAQIANSARTVRLF